jgi:archaeosine synthase alpha-subunit
MIIPKSERSKAPLVGEKVFVHPDMVRANEYVLGGYTPPARDVCVFVPCAKVKPYHTSPSHRNYDEVIFNVLAPEDVHIVAFGTCGVTPRELDTEYPFADYDFVLGDCNVLSVKKRFIELESGRLYRYLEKTRTTYKHRIAYCTGDFRKAMQRACDKTDIGVTIVPHEETLERCRVRGRKFEYGGLSNAQYLADLRGALLSLSGASPQDVRVEALETTLGDNDWYLL